MSISTTRKSLTGRVDAKNSNEALEVVKEYIVSNGFNLDNIDYLHIARDPRSTELEPSFDFEVVA